MGEGIAGKIPNHQNPNTGMPVQLPPKSRFSTPALTEIYEASSHHPAKNMLETTLITGKSAQTSTTMLPQAPSPNVIVVWGPAGCGKSSIAEGVARQLSFVYIEGDKVRATKDKTFSYSFSIAASTTINLNSFG